MNRRGSALLIVLGMFAFMLVSAVSFSVYMRSSRAPSSYVRRNVAARHLVKAALARAIDEIDTAIGNDPFPGVGYNHDYGNDGLNQSDRTKNDNWHGRVFCPSNEVAHSETVSTLSLEALGYLPACLVNEVRYWSRHSRTAKWHPFNYGLGQYAFTAVNVSDFFELNELVDADGVPRQRLNRNSSPDGRISLAHLFRSGNESDMDSGGSLAAAFLKGMSDGGAFGVTPSLTEVPLVSLMDFNLALGGSALGGIASPFYRRLQGATGGFVGLVGEEAVRRQVFMAGGWDGDTNLSYQAYAPLNRVNLQYTECQPFDGYSWFPEATTLAHCYNDVAAGHPFWKPFNQYLPVVSTALLCDYLDFDNVPLSLCLPAAEAVPMVCGVEINDGCVKYHVSKKTVQLVAANPAAGVNQKVKDVYSLHLEVNGLETILTAVYPFANGPQGQPANYTAETFARVFFTADSGAAWENGLRTGLADFSLGDNFTWNVNNDNSGAAFLQVRCGSAAVSAQDASGSGEGLEKSAIQENISIPASGNVVKDVELATLVYEINPNTGTRTLVDAECVNGTGINFYDGNWQAVNFLDKLKSGGDETKYRPSVAVWTRIKSGEKTVDMVPAVPAYDSLNGFAANKGLNGFDRAGGGEAGTPMMRFFAKTDDDVAGIRLTDAYFDANKDASRSPQWTQKAYIANDPRYNWAPEQWYATEQGDNPKNLWFENVKRFRENNAWCDSDIFMSVSDQGYMQSMYEWMMIPQVRSLGDSSNPEWGALEGSTGDYNGVVRTSYDQVAHRGLMWRTYRSDAFYANDAGWGSIDVLPFDEAVSGLRVNPYTDITNIMFGAFANMPRDWWAAGTNDLATSEKNYMKASSVSFKKDYLFDWSCTYKDVFAVTDYWMKTFRGKDRETLYRADDWMTVFEDAVDWCRGEIVYTPPAAADATAVTDIMQELTMAERKFLYGYLKGCFANRSQLFLVFVRAEAAAGGGGSGAGARAVALVWRDPNAPLENGSMPAGRGEDNAGIYLKIQNNQTEAAWRLSKRKHPPHRTRVLFFHQFD